MKTIICLIILELFLFYPTNSICSNEEYIIVTYHTKPPHSIEMVIQEGYHDKIFLRIPQSRPINKDVLVNVKEEIEFLTTQKNPLEMKNGYTFIFLGGYPFWKESENADYIYINFANIILTNNKEIYVWGEINKEKNYRYSEKAGYPISKWSR